MLSIAVVTRSFSERVRSLYFANVFFLFYSKRFFRRVFVHDEALSPAENVLCQFPYSIGQLGLCFCCCVCILFLIRPLSTIDFRLYAFLYLLCLVFAYFRWIYLYMLWCLRPIHILWPFYNKHRLTSPCAYNRLSFSTFFFVSWCFSKVILENEWVTFCSQIGCLARRLNYLSEMELWVLSFDPWSDPTWSLNNLKSFFKLEFQNLCSTAMQQHYILNHKTFAAVINYRPKKQNVSWRPPTKHVPTTVNSTAINAHIKTKTGWNYGFDTITPDQSRPKLLIWWRGSNSARRTFTYCRSDIFLSDQMPYITLKLPDS